MSMIHVDEAIEDSYSQEIIQRARELSPAIDEYVATETYLRETLPESVTPEWLRNKLVRSVLEELEAQGVSIAMEIDAMLDSPELVYNIMTLRAKIDEDKMFKLFHRSTDIAARVREFVTNDVDCLSDIIEYCHEVLPLDEGWESLVNLEENHPGVLVSNDAFARFLDRVFQRLDRLGEPDITDTVDPDEVAKYTKCLIDRRKRIQNVATTIYAEGRLETNVKDQRSAAVATVMRKFERQLSEPQIVEAYAKRNSIEALYGGTIKESDFAFLRKARAPYLEKWDHTFEYWVKHQDSLPTELNIAILIATLYVDCAPEANPRVYVLEAFEQYVGQFSQERYASLREMIDTALSNLVVINGGIFYDTK